MPLDALPVDYLFTMTVLTGDKPAVRIPNAPRGMRLVVTATGGTFEGPRLRGTIPDVAGGDWVTIGSDGIMSLDVRLVLQTDDDASIYMTYTGVGHRHADNSTTPRVVVRFETGDDRYLWLNELQAVGLGASAKGSITYEVYALR